MAKKISCIIVIIFVAYGLFAQPEFKLSAGFGGYFTSDFGGGVEGTGMGFIFTNMKTPYFGGGAFVFFDATFVELNLGFFGVGGEWEDYVFTGSASINKFNLSGVGLDLGVFGKYPFTISEKLSVFPLLGISYRAMLFIKIDDVSEYTTDFNALWFRFGGGLDYSFTNNIYLRTGIYYGIRLENKFEKDEVVLLNEVTMGMANIYNLLGHGLEMKLAVGFRF